MVVSLETRNDTRCQGRDRSTPNGGHSPLARGPAPHSVRPIFQCNFPHVLERKRLPGPDGRGPVLGPFHEHGLPTTCTTGVRFVTRFLRVCRPDRRVGMGDAQPYAAGDQSHVWQTNSACPRPQPLHPIRVLANTRPLPAPQKTAASSGLSLSPCCSQSLGHLHPSFSLANSFKTSRRQVCYRSFPDSRPGHLLVPTPPPLVLVPGSRLHYLWCSPLLALGAHWGWGLLCVPRAQPATSGDRLALQCALCRKRCRLCPSSTKSLTQPCPGQAPSQRQRPQLLQDVGFSGTLTENNHHSSWLQNKLAYLDVWQSQIPPCSSNVSRISSLLSNRSVD